jgi:hypothetical protein
MSSNTGCVAGSPDRYEPLPGFTELPAWIWRRLGSRGRTGVVVALVLAVAGTVVLVPAIDRARDQRSAAEQRTREVLHERRIRALEAEQRPHFGRVGARSHAAGVNEVEAAIVADARRRVGAGTLDGPIRRVECEPFPRSLNPERLLARRRVRLACLAVTSAFEGGALGHPYRALIDFATARYAFCKVSGRPDPTPDPDVTTPRACGG